MCATNSTKNGINQSKVRELQKQLLDLIAQFRQKLEELPIEEQKAVSRTLSDFSKPCQILVIWGENPEFQIMLITHLDNIEDKTIEIYGSIQNTKLIDYIEEKVLRDSKIIHQIITQGKVFSSLRVSAKEEIESYFARALKGIQRLYNPLAGPFKPLINGKSRLNFENIYVVGWTIRGSLLNFGVEEITNNCLNEISSIAKPSPPSPPKKERVVLEGFGTWIYPPIWIGETPRPKSFKERMTWPLSILFPPQDRAVTENYKGRPLVLMRDGYIAIGEKDKKKALELLNELMSTFLLRGINVNAIREIDLGEAKLTESGATFSWSPYSSRAQLAYKRTFDFIPIEKRTISEENISKTIKLAEILTSNEKIKTILLLFLETHTYFTNTEFKQALIMAWIILEEFYIKDLWSSQISKITSNKDRLSKLGSWKVDKQLEALNIAHVLQNDEYDLLMKIKDARNDVVHEGKEPPKEIVEKCLNHVFKVVQKYVGEHIGRAIPKL